MIITLCGGNTYALNKETTRLVDEFASENGYDGVDKLEAGEIDSNRLNQAIYSVSILSPNKLVVLKNATKKVDISAAVIDILNKMPANTDLILIEPTIDKRTSLYKTLQKKTDLREFKPLDGTKASDKASLVKWAMDVSKEKGGSLGTQEASLLIDRVGFDQLLLASEINKLLIYDLKITKDSIMELTVANPQSTTFDLLEAAFNGRLQKLEELYKEQREIGVDPQMIIGLIAWQLQVISLIKYSDAISPETISSITKLHPYTVRKSQPIANGLSNLKLKQLVAKLSDIDVASKNVSIDVDSALQTYLFSLSEN
jgi:DNA polymerase-3 subunit delta